MTMWVIIWAIDALDSDAASTGIPNDARSRKEGVCSHEKKLIWRSLTITCAQISECWPRNATKRAKRRLAGIELFDTGRLPLVGLRYERVLRGSPRIMVKLTRKFDG